MTNPIILVGPADDPQVQALQTAASQRGVSTAVLHLSAHHPSEWQWAANGIAVGDLRVSEALGVFVRSVPILLPEHKAPWLTESDEVEWLEQAAARQRMHGFYKSLQLSLEERGVPVVNPLWGFAYHRSKPGADLALALAGVPVPRGVATTEPARVNDLMAEVGAVVYKPVAGGGRCRVLRQGDLEAKAHRLARTPCYFQELIPGRNLRVYTMADRILAAFDIEADDVDFRGRETKISRIALSPEVEETAIRAAEVLGLPFSGSDIKLCPDGRHVVLDVNPSPMFAGLDGTVDGAIGRGIVDHLIGSRP